MRSGDFAVGRGENQCVACDRASTCRAPLGIEQTVVSRVSSSPRSTCWIISLASLTPSQSFVSLTIFAPRVTDNHNCRGKTKNTFLSYF